MSNFLMSLKSTKSNRTIQVALISGSGFFLEGMHNILRDEGCINIVYQALSAKRVGKCLVEIKPDFLFLDNRTIKISITKLLNLMTKNGLSTRLILFRNNENVRRALHSRNKINSSNTIYLAKETNSSKLIEIIKNSNNSISTKEPVPDHNKNGKLTLMETKVAELITFGFRNKEIGNRLSITEGTVKCHLTSIFMKLGLQSRYQLMAYEKRLRRQSL